MSHFTNIQLQFKDRNCLVEALVEMGWSLDKIELHNSPSNLYGWHGDVRQDCANIIIRRKYVGRDSNDIGFRLEPDGTYTAIISEFDSRTNYGSTWVNRLKQTYGVKVAKKQARLKGFSVQETKKSDGTVTLVLMKAG